MENSETLSFTNSFGTVSSKRIIINYKRGTEEILLSHIDSVSFKHERNYFFAIGGFAVGILVIVFMLNVLGGLGGMEVLIILAIALIGFLSGLANWIGHHNIILNTSGKDRKLLKVEMAKTREGKHFVEAIKKEVFK